MDFSQIWTEKYRPKKLDEMINQEHIVKRLRAFVKDGSIPHLLFSGPPGVGKTTAALCLARELFGEQWKENYLELNASDERGIDVIRVKVKDFARTRPIGGNFKIIFLDEADALTKDAQQALRRTMENFSSVCRFILSCNYPSKIIEPIQSRTVVFRFRHFEEGDLRGMLERVAKGEGLEVSEGGYRALVEVAGGDARFALNVLQSAAASGEKIEEGTVYEVASRAKPREVEELVRLALDGKFSEARKRVLGLLVDKGVSGDVLLREIHRAVVGMDIPEGEKAELINILGEVDFRILEGANELIQLDALLARMSARRLR